MHNEVVKSDIHSTDTHGYSEVVFSVTHLLGFSFAPRLKNLKAKTMYSFHSHPRKMYQEQGFKILPTQYINAERFEKHWDDILRFVGTIKLKHTTASQLFKRLIENAIVCWNYLFAIRLIANESDPERRKEVLETLRRDSMLTWQHINLHGKYDFSDEKREDSRKLGVCQPVMTNSIADYVPLCRSTQWCGNPTAPAPSAR
jgi:hypothetical protein